MGWLAVPVIGRIPHLMIMLHGEYIDRIGEKELILTVILGSE
jgi:hypothetical protein